MHCEDIWNIYPIYNGVGVAVFTIGIIYYCNAMLTVWWIHSQRGKALDGDEMAAKYVIFPIYVPFMWTSAISDIIVASLLIFSDVNMSGSNGWPESIFVALTFSFQHFAIEGVALLLMQYGCGYQAARRAGLLAFIWVCITFALYIIMLKSAYHFMIVAELSMQSILLVFYLCLWVLPERWFFRRKAIVPYSKFWFSFRLLSVLMDVAILSMGGCFKHLYIFPLILVVSLKPYLIYLTLLKDSIWWQGVSTEQSSDGNKTGAGHDGTHSGHLRSPLLGIEVSYVDAQELAQEVDNLTTEGTVRLLNFAYISLDSSALLGSGSFSKVYRGAYKGTPVAIKMLFTNDLNPEVIRRCSSEAQILSKISHPNVVDIFGVAVLPPSVCIVLEICQYGSLSDVIRGGIITVRGIGQVPRRVLPLSMTDRMFLALGCARGLTALHSYSCDLVHRDIKSSNFLVDGQLNAKICDLELGGTRSHQIDIHKDGMLCTWQAPEVLRSETVTQGSDVYSLGLVLWEIVSGMVPFTEYGRDTDQLMYQVLRGARPDMTHAMQDDCPPSYSRLISSCWDQDPVNRPKALEVCEELYKNCWLHMVHSRIRETTKVVDLSVLTQAYEKEKSAAAVRTAFTSGRPSQFGPRQNLPTDVARAISVFRMERAWDDLETLGAALIIGAQFPYLVIGATKKWSQVTGFLMSEIIAKDLSFLEGAQSNKVLFRHVCAEVCRGNAAHACLTHYRRDGSAFVNSIHGFPVFDGNRVIGEDAAPSSGYTDDEDGDLASGGSANGEHVCDPVGGHQIVHGPEISDTDSFSTAVSSGVHLESVQQTSNIKKQQRHSDKSKKSANQSLLRGSASASDSIHTDQALTIRKKRKSPKAADLSRVALRGPDYGAILNQSATTAFIVLQFSVIVDSRSHI